MGRNDVWISPADSGGRLSKQALLVEIASEKGCILDLRNRPPRTALFFERGDFLRLVEWVDGRIDESDPMVHEIVGDLRARGLIQDAFATDGESTASDEQHVSAQPKLQVAIELGEDALSCVSNSFAAVLEQRLSPGVKLTNRLNVRLLHLDRFEPTRLVQEIPQMIRRLLAEAGLGAVALTWEYICSKDTISAEVAHALDRIGSVRIAIPDDATAGQDLGSGAKLMDIVGSLVGAGWDVVPTLFAGVGDHLESRVDWWLKANSLVGVNIEPCLYDEQLGTRASPIRSIPDAHQCASRVASITDVLQNITHLCNPWKIAVAHAMVPMQRTATTLVERSSVIAANGTVYPSLYDWDVSRRDEAPISIGSDRGPIDSNSVAPNCNECAVEPLCGRRFISETGNALLESQQIGAATASAEYECALRKELLKLLVDGWVAEIKGRESQPNAEDRRQDGAKRIVSFDGGVVSIRKVDTH